MTAFSQEALVFARTCSITSGSIWMLRGSRVIAWLVIEIAQELD